MISKKKPLKKNPASEDRTKILLQQAYRRINRAVELEGCAGTGSGFATQSFRYPVAKTCFFHQIEVRMMGSMGTAELKPMPAVPGIDVLGMLEAAHTCFLPQW